MSQQTTDVKWYYAVEEERSGPVSFAELSDLLMKRELHADSLVWRKGFDDWKPAESVPALAPFIPGASSLGLKKRAEASASPTEPEISIEGILEDANRGSENRARKQQRKSDENDRFRNHASSGPRSIEWNWFLWYAGISVIAGCCLALIDPDRLPEGVMSFADSRVDLALAGLYIVSLINVLPLSIYLLVLYFKNGVLWGLASIFIPFAALVYLFKFWDIMWRGILFSLVNHAVLLALFYAMNSEAFLELVKP